MAIRQSIFSLAILFNLSAVAQAASISGKIVAQGKDKILISSDNAVALKLGDVLSLNKDCSLEVVKKTPGRVILSTELCEDKSTLVKGKSLVLSKDVASETTATDDQFDSSASGSTSGSARAWIPATSGKASNGFRISLVKAFLDVKLEASDGSDSGSAKGDLDQEIGFALGYANININSIGFTSRLLYSTFERSLQSLRLDGNATFGFNEYLYGLGGINVHKFTNSGTNKLDAGIGFQAGVGTQVNKNFGFELAYIFTNNSASKGDESLDVQVSGLELSLHTTF